MTRRFVIFLAATLLWWSGGKAQAAARVQAGSCATCHSAWERLLPATHPTVKGKNLGVCLSCHGLQSGEKPEVNPFSARLHRAHLDGQSKVPCTVCHTWVPGKSFGLRQQKGSLGRPSKAAMVRLGELFRSWAGSGFLDHLHAKANVTCVGCHGQGIPDEDATVDDDRCLACHGSLEALAERSASREFPKRNPHKSHMVNLACTICHRGHAPSKVYCLECHKGFTMRIPGG